MDTEPATVVGWKMIDATFEDWIRRLIGVHGSQGAVARLAGISDSAFGRQIKEGSLGLEPLLRLALATGENPSKVLRRAGKGELAALLEQSYGPPTPTPPHLREIAELLGQLPDVQAQKLAETTILPSLRVIVPALKRSR